MYNLRATGAHGSKSKTGKSAPGSSNNAVMFSAALQDHIMKKGNFRIDSDLLGPKSTKTKLPAISRKPVSSKDVIPSKVETEIRSLAEREKKSILPYESEALKKLKEAKSD